LKGYQRKRYFFAVRPETVVVKIICRGKKGKWEAREKTQTGV